MPSGESTNVLEIMARVFHEAQAAIISRCQLATGQEGRAPRIAPFWCPSPTKHDSAEIHFTPPPHTQTTGNLAWVKDFLLERRWWNLAESGLALSLCAKRAVGEGQVSPNVCPADPSEMWSKLLLTRESRAPRDKGGPK